MITLDAFVGRYAAPTLKAAGFRRRRKEFLIDGPRGMIGAVGIYPGRGSGEVLGFEVQYGVITPGVLAWRVSRGVPRPGWLTTSDALLRGVLISPMPSPANDIDPFRWLVEPDAEDRVGRVLADALAAEVIPTLHAWFDPRTLARAVDLSVAGRFSGAGLPGQAAALALYDAGPSTELDQHVAALAPDDPMRQWIERRLGANDQDAAR